MNRVVADTNIYVSIYQFGGAITAIIDYAIAGKIALFISPPIIEELKGVLKEKFAWPDERLNNTIQTLWAFTHLVEPGETINETSDPADNRILECAFEAKADVIVSGDRHLLKLQTFRGIPIVTPRQFLDSLK